MLVAIVAITVSRVLLVGTVYGPLGRTQRRFPRVLALVITWSELRGAVCFAAALSLPICLPSRDLLRMLTFGSALSTLSTQALTIHPLLQRLGIGGDDITRHGAERRIGRLRMIGGYPGIGYGAANRRRRFAPGAGHPRRVNS